MRRACAISHQSIPAQLIEPVLRLRDDLVAATASKAALADTMLYRHERVQKDKAKAPWIEQGRVPTGR